MVDPITPQAILRERQAILRLHAAINRPPADAHERQRICALVWLWENDPTTRRLWTHTAA